MRGTYIHPVVDLQRRSFKGVLARILACVTQVAGVVLPGDRQLADILRGDLIKAGKTLTGSGPAIRRPVLACRLGATGGRCITDLPLKRVRIMKHERNHDHQHYPQRTAEKGMKTTVIEARTCLIKRPHHPGQRQPEADQRKQITAGDPLPFVKADFVDDPDQNPPHEQCVQGQRRLLFQKDQGCRGQQDQSNDRVGGRAPGSDQLRTHEQQNKTQYRDHDTCHFQNHRPCPFLL